MNSLQGNTLRDLNPSRLDYQSIDAAPICLSQILNALMIALCIKFYPEPFELLRLFARVVLISSAKFGQDSINPFLALCVCPTPFGGSGGADNGVCVRDMCSFLVRRRRFLLRVFGAHLFLSSSSYDWSSRFRTLRAICVSLKIFGCVKCKGN
jgi:hypothetical protein